MRKSRPLHGQAPAGWFPEGVPVICYDCWWDRKIISEEDWDHGRHVPMSYRIPCHYCKKMTCAQRIIEKRFGKLAATPIELMGAFDVFRVDEPSEESL